jgi:RNA polymerase sigma factor (sigma-70 family)
MAPDGAGACPSDLDRFLQAMGPKLKWLLSTYHIPPEDAEDVLQQALLALVHQWSTVREPEAWLIVTLRRHCQMYWRTHRRRLYAAVDSALLEFLSQPVAGRQERDDLLFDLRGVIDRLPSRCRTLLSLRFEAGYEPAEVARRLGYRASSISKMTTRCLAALARELVIAPASRRGRHDTRAAATPVSVRPRR